MTISITSPTSNTGAIQQNGSNVLTIDSSNRLTATNGIYINGALASGYTMKNRIINGKMEIDQRNNGASVTNTVATATALYTLDRWGAWGSQASKYTVQQVSGNANTTQGFQQSLKVTSSSAYTVGSGEFFAISQQIEGYNVADLAWGTAGAKTVTLSFWVYSSLTGTFGGSIQNSAGNRSYPFSYTISSANTWEQKTITIAGDTSGTWLVTNGTGMYVFFGLGMGSTYSGTAGAWVAGNYLTVTGATSVVGTNGATFYITGVQLEVGSTATAFEWRPYGMELALCQRYYQQVGFATAIGDATTTSARIICPLFVPLRAQPSIDRKSTRLNSSHTDISRMPSSA